MKTFPGRDYRKIRTHQSCSIPKNFPRWYEILSRAGTRLYARKSIRAVGYVTIFHRYNYQSEDVLVQIAMENYTIQRRLSEKQNHDIEDCYECMFVLRGRGNNKNKV